MTSKKIKEEREKHTASTMSVTRQYLQDAVKALELNAKFVNAVLKEAGIPATSSRLVFRCCCRDTKHIDEFEQLVASFKEKYKGTIDNVIFETASHTIYIFGTPPEHEAPLTN